MSDELKMKEILEKLKEQSRPQLRDEAQQLTAVACNQFFKHFGEEKVHILGSTGENLKLRTEKDAGDVDILLCSGKLKIPVDNLEFRKDTPCFAWIKADNLDINCVNNNYIQSKLLRTFGTEIFNVGRGVIHLVSLAAINVKGIQQQKTVLRSSSKVGLATTEYFGLTFLEETSPDLNEVRKCLRDAREEETRETLLKRMKNMHISSDNINCFVTSFVTIFPLLDDSHLTEKDEGQIKHMLKAIKEGEQLIDKITKTIGIREQYEIGDDRKIDKVSDEMAPNVPDQFHAQYDSKRSKDFVPALKVEGKLKCMDAWAKRQREWPSGTVVGEIDKMDVYVVSKSAPIDPDPEKDFCLSFNLAERKLSECLSHSQRNVLLIFKCFLKGLIKKTHIDKKRELRLTSYHLKTSLYWVAEREDPKCWTDENIIECVEKVSKFLIDSLENKYLQHYFMKSNLFVGFKESEENEESDFKILINILQTIRKDPVGSADAFFKANDGLPTRIQLSKEEMLDIIIIPQDEVGNEEIYVAADALLDFQSGLNDIIRNPSVQTSDVNAFIHEAMLALAQPYLEDFFHRSDDSKAKNRPDDRTAKALEKLRKFIKCPLSNNIEKERLEQEFKECLASPQELI